MYAVWLSVGQTASYVCFVMRLPGYGHIIITFKQRKRYTQRIEPFSTKRTCWTNLSANSNCIAWKVSGLVFKTTNKLSATSMQKGKVKQDINSVRMSTNNRVTTENNCTYFFLTRFLPVWVNRLYDSLVWVSGELHCRQQWCYSETQTSFTGSYATFLKSAHSAV